MTAVPVVPVKCVCILSTLDCLALYVLLEALSRFVGRYFNHIKLSIVDCEFLFSLTLIA